MVVTIESLLLQTVLCSNQSNFWWFLQQYHTCLHDEQHDIAWQPHILQSFGNSNRISGSMTLLTLVSLVSLSLSSLSSTDDG